jgi:plastocyanin
MKNFQMLKTLFYLSLSIAILNSCTTSTGNHSDQNNSTYEKAEPETHIVEIALMKFQPAVLTVKKGDTIIFINHDLVIHNITEETNKLWASSSLQNGKSWTLIATESTVYFCSIHPVMKGKIVVE